MSRIPVKTMQGEPAGEWELAEGLLVHDRGRQALHDAVIAEQAAQRAGTASTRTKGEVAGRGSKPYRQKGTGRARAGYLRSPVRRGGGVAFGPKPRDFAVRLPKKAARLAFRRALSEKIAAGELVVLDSLSLPEARTRHVAELHRRLGEPPGLLLVVPAVDEALARAVRNHPAVDAVSAARLGVVTLLRFPLVAVTREAMEALEARVKAPVRRGA